MNVQKNQCWVFGDTVDEQVGGPGIVRKVLAYSDNLMCVENTFDTGAIGPLHSHPHTQLTYVASGIFEFTIEKETHIVKQGDTLLKQNGIQHGCKCIKSGVLVDFFSPIRRDFIDEK